MILRRVIEHVRAQAWTAILLDFVIVVLGVFIGLQVQDWSQRQADRRREIQIVTGLLADLEIDRSNYANGLAFDERQVGAANVSLEGANLPLIEFEWAGVRTDFVNYSFELSETSDFPAARRDRLWNEIVTGYFPTTSTSTYDAMVGAGDIRIVRDRDIVGEIQLYHSRTAAVEQQNNKLLAIRQNTLNVGAAYGLAPLVSMPAEDYFRLVASEPQLAATIRVQATYAMFHHGEIKTADAQAAQLEDRLRAYLDTLN